MQLLNDHQISINLMNNRAINERLSSKSLILLKIIEGVGGRKMTRAAEDNLTAHNFSISRRNPTTPLKTSSTNSSKTLCIAPQSILILKTINHTNAQLNALTRPYNA